MSRAAFFELDLEGLRAWCAERGMPAFAAGQMARWVYERGVVDPAAMTDLSSAARRRVAEEMTFLQGRIAAHRSATDGTQKLLVAWPRNDAAPAEADGGAGTGAGAEAGAADAAGPRATPLSLAPGTPGGQRAPAERETECVMIPADGRRTACISSQVGCPVGCRFCASGLGGLEGNLSRGRIVEQVWHLARLPDVGRISHVVFMGMGEPLANFSAVTDAIRTLHAPWGFGISARRITVSTVGLPAAIRRLCGFEIPVTLALSLHAPNDALRRSIIPWAEYSTIAELLDACQEWFRKTGREITLEYILLGGLNDRPEHAAELGAVARTLRANVNLIRYNEVAGLPYRRPSTEDVHVFQEILRQHGVNTHIRRSRGRDIAAACGQLRHESRRAG
ncbi:MAG: 23S rRNA (adenine(2503)-C(2))-methyltransferase RlmN [Phycisphaerales bacterium]